MGRGRGSGFRNDNEAELTALQHPAAAPPIIESARTGIDRIEDTVLANGRCVWRRPWSAVLQEHKLHAPSVAKPADDLPVEFDTLPEPPETPGAPASDTKCFDPDRPPRWDGRREPLHAAFRRYPHAAGG